MFKKKILIIDDTELMIKLIKDILEEAEYEVVTASNGYEGLRKVREEKPDLVILDIVMPGIDGFEVCKSLRADESNNLMPIIMLTAQQNEDDKLTGLELGADDYITKPFKVKILMAKINRILGKNNQGFLQVKELKLHRQQRKVLVESEEVVLAPKEFDLLEYMIINKNIVLSRDQILEEIWGYDFEGGIRVVDNHIKKLRSKLQPFSQRIKTVIGKGYVIEG